MLIDFQAFTPWSALAGGVLIGVATAMFALLNGRIAGISSVIGGLLQPKKGDVAWRAVFIFGLIVAPLIAGLFSAPPAIQIDAGYPAIVLAGLLVGIGTRYGSGCTSGHGVCGVSRFSVRSIIATATFMLTGIVTVYVLRHLFGA